MVLMVSLAVVYALWERRKYEAWRDDYASLILKQMPSFTAKHLPGGRDLTGEDALAMFTNGLFVHFWGTWCAPCEAELPDLIDLARRYADKGVGFLLLSVKDEDEKIDKFLRRFKQDWPRNIIVAHDREGASLDVFGTVRVPETYLFKPNGESAAKFVGPQGWDGPSYRRRIDLALSLSETPVGQAIETH